MRFEILTLFKFLNNIIINAQLKNDNIDTYVDKCNCTQSRRLFSLSSWRYHGINYEINPIGIKSPNQQLSYPLLSRNSDSNWDGHVILNTIVSACIFSVHLLANTHYTAERNRITPWKKLQEATNQR